MTIYFLKREIIPFIFLLFFITLQSCDNKKDMVLLKVSELGPAKVSDSSLVAVFEKELKRNIRLEYSLSEDTALKRLENKEIDFAIIPNNVEGYKIGRNIRSVTPLLPRILVILTYNIPGVDSMSVKQLFENNHVVYEDMSRLDSIFFESFFNSFGISRNKTHLPFVHKINTGNWIDSSFVYVGLTHLHNPIMKKLIDKGADFFPLDDVSNLGKGSSVEGFNFDYPKLSPFILPKSFYYGKPEKPVLTVVIPDVLITCKDMDKYIVYNIKKTIYEKKAELIEKDNIYNLLYQNIGNIILSFPEHKGAREYLERNEPSIWTRYASLLWPFLSIIAILAGAFASLKRHIKQRKKIRVETLYTDLLQIRKRAIVSNDLENRNDLLKKLRLIRSKAFDALMNNKLSANESFSIFLSLYSEITEEILEMDKKKVSSNNS